MLGQAFDDVLLAAQTGAGWAFERLYDDLAGVVTGYVRQQGAADPDDVASETFLHAFRSIGTFTGGEEDFRSWVFTIAHRRLVDAHRRAARRPQATPIGAPTEVEEAGAGTAAVVDEAADRSVMDEEEWARLEQHLAVLTPLQRDVVLLRVVAGMSVAETAAVVERSEEAVRQLQRRGLRRLEEHLAASVAAPAEEADPAGR